MSRPQTHEQRLLYKADQYLSCLAHTHEERLEILEAVAASKSHCDIIEFSAFGSQAASYIGRKKINCHSRFGPF